VVTRHCEALFNRSNLISDYFQIFEKGPVFKLFPFIKTLIICIKYKPDLIITGPLPTTIVLYARFIKFILTDICHLKTDILINASFHPTDPDFIKKPLISTLKSADYIWTLSDFETEYFKQEFGVPPSKLINVGNGIDSSFLLHHNSYLISHISRLLYVGSFSAHKNIPDLIKAFAILSPEYPDLTLTLAGQKTLYWPTIKKEIDNLPPDIKHRIKIIFSFTDQLKSEIYDLSSILIQPSSQESFGLTLIEAWARLRPVIVSDIPQFIELINKSNGGLVFKLNNPTDLAHQIKTLLADPKLNHQLAQNGYIYTKKFHTWDKIGKIICQKVI
jgi:glycosyltransferase involved in cell wall biosynthesis